MRKVLVVLALMFTFVISNGQDVETTTKENVKIETTSNIVENSFNGNVSGTFGVLNGKVRLQYERPFKDRASYGINVNYYMVNWTGITGEPFIRIYGKNDGNAEGFFGQAKLIYGNLSNMSYGSHNGAIENKRWSTFGFGLNFGYKFLLSNKFTIEFLSGLRILSPPVYKYKDGVNEDNAMAITEGIGWYLTTGFPLDFQLKFGFQF